MSGFNSYLAKGQDERDKPLDMVWLLRGGGTDVYTLISNLARLQRLLPNDHLSSSFPYVLSDSGGAYPGSGLAAVNPLDPILFPARFKQKMPEYLAKDRTLAEAALREDIGDMRVRDAAIPITISTVEISSNFRREYFTHFPESYGTARSGMELPETTNGDIPLAQAVLASSAFAAYLGDYKIGDRRFMDMAFMETHSSNLINFAVKHAQACPDRRIVCVVFGNNFSDIHISPEEKISLQGLRRHFGEAVRAFAHDDIIHVAQSLFGAENVIDLSIYVDQPFHEKDKAALPHAFRSDELAIRERMEWTDKILDGSPHHQQTIERLAEMIKRSSLPYTHQRFSVKREDANSHQTLQSLTPQERFLSTLQDYNIPATMIAMIIGEILKPVIRTAGNGIDQASSLLARHWRSTEEWRAHQADSLWSKLLPNHPVRRHTANDNPLAKLPSQNHS